MTTVTKEKISYTKKYEFQIRKPFKFRNIIGLGVDTPSTDFGQSKDFKTHQILGSANVWGLENVANLDALPPKGFTILNMVYKLKDGSGAPSRQRTHIVAKNLFIGRLVIGHNNVK